MANKTKIDIKFVEASDKWTHDDCGGEVDTDRLYWLCKKCGSFVYVAICNGNSKALDVIRKFYGK